MSKRARWLVVVGGVALLLLLFLLASWRAPEPEAEVAPLAPAAREPAHRPCSDILALSPAQPATAPGASSEPVPTLDDGPAPTTDRIGFPVDYRERFSPYFVVDRPDLREVRVACANLLAASAAPDQPLPYGSVLVMELWSVAVDEQGRPIFEASGKLIREELRALFVMRKGEGFGEAYGPARSGEWEYVAYRPDGSYWVPPEQSHGCAACHRQQASAEADWLFRRRFFATFGIVREAGLDEVVAFHYLFRPGTMTVRVGTTITWSNLDEVGYSVTAADGSFDSGLLPPGQRFSHTFERAGSFEYSSSLHPGMKGTIWVTD